MSSVELEAVASCLHERTFEKGALLFNEGAGCERVFVVRSGRVKLYRTGTTGREQILQILKEGDTCACNPGTREWHCTTSGEALTSCNVWFLSRTDYVNLVQTNEKVAHSLNQLFAHKLQCLSNLLEEVSLKDAKKRLVKFLLDMADQERKKPGADQVLFIPFTREEIAQRLGTTRETVARYLSQLRQEKLVDIKPYQIILLNPEGLKQLLY